MCLLLLRLRQNLSQLRKSYKERKLLEKIKERVFSIYNKILFPLIMVSIIPFFLILGTESLKSNHYIQSAIGQVFVTIVISMIFYLEVKQLFIEIDKKHNLLKIPRCHHSYVGIYLIFQLVSSFLVVLSYIFNGIFA